MIPQPDERETAVTTDARKLRSREAIYSAFLGLLEQKTLEQISIREIAAAAGVGHATFYRHYPSKEALLNHLAADEIRRLVNLTLPVMDAADSAAACVTLCDHINNHRTLWTTLLTGGAAATLKEELLRISREVAATHARPADGWMPLELKVILSVSSMVETLSWWLRQERPLPVTEIAAYIDRIISAHA